MSQSRREKSFPKVRVVSTLAHRDKLYRYMSVFMYRPTGDFTLYNKDRRKLYSISIREQNVSLNNNNLLNHDILYRTLYFL